LRRSFATGSARIGVGIPTIERCLNYWLGSVIAIKRHDFAAEMKDASPSVGAHF
jgi:hypothetical protein